MSLTHANRLCKSKHAWPYFGPKKCHIPHPFSDLAYAEITSSLLRLKIEKSISNSQNFSFFLIQLQLKRQICSIPDQNGQSLCPFSDRNGTKTINFRATYTLWLKYSKHYLDLFVVLHLWRVEDTNKSGLISLVSKFVPRVLSYSTKRRRGSWERGWWLRWFRTNSCFWRDAWFVSVVRNANVCFRVLISRKKIIFRMLERLETPGQFVFWILAKPWIGKASRKPFKIIKFLRLPIWLW